VLLELTIAAICALALSLVLNRVMLSVAPCLGLMDQPGTRRIHSSPIPRAGGIAIWLSFLLVVTAGLASGLLETHGSLSWQWLGAFTAGSLVLMVAGVIDDRRGLPPLVKLAAHALAPVVFSLLLPVHTGLFPEDWPWYFDVAAFVIWSVVLINAFNLIDGLDGLCGGLAAVATLGLAVIALMNERSDAALLLLVMGGAIVGFLKYNLNPARIFLGDAGSMLIGFFLATAATDAVGRKAVVGIILLPVAVAGVPLLDVLLAIWRRGGRHLMRQLRGEKVEGGIFDADRDHLHHRLLDSGGSQRKVAIILQGIAIVLAVIAFLPILFGKQMLALSVIGLLVVGLVGLRHLARVEIEQTGSVVHMAIKLPGNRRRVAMALFIYDIIILAFAGVMGVLVETNLLVRHADEQKLLQFIIVFTILGCLSTLLAKVHLRLWVRATMRDIISLQFWLLVAALATFTLFSLAYQSLEWIGMRMALISYLFAAIAICLPRVALDLFREFGLEARHRNPMNSTGDTCEPVVVLGAGNLGTLLLDHLKSSNHDDYVGMRVLGYLDEESALHGRRLRTFRILGDLSMIPSLVKDQGLRGIVLAINRPRRELLEQLECLAEEYKLRIYRWKVGIRPLEDDLQETYEGPETLLTKPELESANKEALSSDGKSENG
jgi:UDP-N-acetylmuramyl pentapeptide phosphotransferase/UDP-N-acetylglucosamine-1-phosphate transferase